MKIKDVKTIENDRTFNKGDIIRSFDFKCYLVEKVVKNIHTEELMMEYSSLNAEDDYISYVMSLDSFLEPIDKTKYPETNQKYKFEKISKKDYYKIDKK